MGIHDQSAPTRNRIVLPLNAGKERIGRQPIRAAMDVLTSAVSS
jgi:hypothetical protein